jgi:hypothetical protein
VIGFARTPLAKLSETDRVGLLLSLRRCNAEGFIFCRNRPPQVAELCDLRWSVFYVMRFDIKRLIRIIDRKKYESLEQGAFFARLAFFLIILATLGLLTH